MEVSPGPQWKNEEDKRVTQQAQVSLYSKGLKALHNSTIQPTRHIYCTLVSLQSCSSSLRGWKPSSDKWPPFVFSGTLQKSSTTQRGRDGLFQSLLYVGDNIQQRSWLMHRGGAASSTRLNLASFRLFLRSSGWLCGTSVGHLRAAETHTQSSGQVDAEHSHRAACSRWSKMNIFTSRNTRTQTAETKSWMFLRRCGGIKCCCTHTFSNPSFLAFVS